MTIDLAGDKLLLQTMPVSVTYRCYMGQSEEVLLSFVIFQRKRNTLGICKVLSGAVQPFFSKLKITSFINFLGGA